MPKIILIAYTLQSKGIPLSLVPRCILPPPHIDKTTYVLSGDNLTATYHCDEGHIRSSSSSTQSLICKTSDQDITTWSWSFPNLTCVPGMLAILPCILQAQVLYIFQRLTRGSVQYLIVCSSWPISNTGTCRDWNSNFSLKLYVGMLVLQSDSC